MIDGSSRFSVLTSDGLRWPDLEAVDGILLYRATEAAVSGPRGR